jgi:hypothetical protein
MIQAFSLIFNFFNKASPCGDTRILSTQNRYSNQDKRGTVYQSEFHADFKSAHRFLFGCVFPEIYQFL